MSKEKCDFPISLERSVLKVGRKRSKCTGNAKFDIIFQGKKMRVCGMHRQYDKRERVFG